MRQPILYIFIGYPGAGKTTVAKYIAQQTGAIHLWADKERRNMFNSPTHSIQESKRLYDVLDDKTERLLSEGKSVIFDTNFNYRSDRQLLRAIADKYGATTRLIWLTTPKNIAKARALHHTHRDHNGYPVTMTVAEFDRLSNHLEPPLSAEQAIKIDGSRIDLDSISAQLDLLGDIDGRIGPTN